MNCSSHQAVLGGLPNPAVKGTNIGGAHLCTHRAPGAPLFAPYLLR